MKFLKAKSPFQGPTIPNLKKNSSSSSSFWQPSNSKCSWIRANLLQANQLWTLLSCMPDSWGSISTCNKCSPTTTSLINEEKTSNYKTATKRDVKRNKIDWLQFQLTDTPTSANEFPHLHLDIYIIYVLTHESRKGFEDSVKKSNQLSGQSQFLTHTWVKSSL